MDIKEKSRWIVGGASCIGAGHTQEGKPREDSFYCEDWGNYWGISIVSDGAGSRKKSATGSWLISNEYAPKIFKRHLKPYFDNSDPITSEQWQEMSLKAFYECVYNLYEYCETQHDDIELYGCTVIVIVYSPLGILCAQIGDGRACYRDSAGEWKACMKPYNPDPQEPSATIFITSPFWEDFTIAKNYIGSMVCEGATAFSLLSDGVESYCFICTPRNPITGDDPNTPSQAFFESIYKSFNQVKADESVINAELNDYLTNNVRLAQEIDDKTLIFGFLSNESVVNAPSPNSE